LHQAQIAIQRFDTLIQQRRREVGELLRFNSIIMPAYELEIQIFDTSFQITNDSVFIDRVFHFIRTNKAIILLKGLDENMLIQRENTYRREINHLHKEENQLKCQNKDSIQQLLKAIQNKYNVLKQELKKEHPEYYALKYDRNTIDIKQMQSHTDKQTAVIEYYLAEETLYILMIEKNDKHIFNIPKLANLFSQIKSYRQAINWGFNDTIPPPCIYQKFTMLGTSLYKHILAQPLEAIASKDIKQLLIIPGDQSILNSLPFDLLLSDSHSIEEKNYKVLPYVLKKYAVSYVYSSSFLINVFQQKQRQPLYNYILNLPKYESYYLKNGMPRHLALQQAKLSYLQISDNNFADHPFFWSGFIVSDNM